MDKGIHSLVHRRIQEAVMNHVIGAGGSSNLIYFMCELKAYPTPEHFYGKLEALVIFYALIFLPLVVLELWERRK